MLYKRHHNVQYIYRVLVCSVHTYSLGFSVLPLLDNIPMHLRELHQAISFVVDMKLTCQRAISRFHKKRYHQQLFFQ